MQIICATETENMFCRCAVVQVSLICSEQAAVGPALSETLSWDAARLHTAQVRALCHAVLRCASCHAALCLFCVQL